MVTYRLLIKRSVRREIDRLPGHIRQRVRRALAALTLEPRPRAARPLRGDLAGYWRLRLDEYRIIYSVDDERLTVEVMRLGQRSPTTYDALE
jgi:mRNA interferase RelE/StbE